MLKSLVYYKRTSKIKNIYLKYFILELNLYGKTFARVPETPDFPKVPKNPDFPKVPENRHFPTKKSLSKTDRLKKLL